MCADVDVVGRNKRRGRRICADVVVVKVVSVLPSEDVPRFSHRQPDTSSVDEVGGHQLWRKTTEKVPH